MSRFAIVVAAMIVTAAPKAFGALAGPADPQKPAPPASQPRPGDRPSSGFLDLKSSAAVISRRLIGDPARRKRAVKRDGLLTEKPGETEKPSDSFISPDESWQGVLPKTWQAAEVSQGGVDFLFLTPSGATPQTATRMIFVLGGILGAREAAFPDTDLLTAGMGVMAQSLTQSFGLRMEVKKPAAKVTLGTRDAAAMEYAADLPGQNASLGFWGGFARQAGYCMLVAALGRGDDYSAAQQVASRLLETAKSYQAPPNPELERALLGRWSGILSVSTTATSSRSSTVTYQFNPDRTFWRRISHSHSSSSGGGGSLSGASDNFDQGTFAVNGRHVIVKLRQGGELRLRIDGVGAGGQARGLKIGGNEVVRSEI